MASEQPLIPRNGYGSDNESSSDLSDHENVKPEQMEISVEVKSEAKSVEYKEFNEIERNDEVPLSMEYKSQAKEGNENSTAAVYKSFRDHDLLTDVTLVIGEERLRAHKILLCKLPYFQKMFCSRMSELNQEVIPIKLNEGPEIINSACFKAIIDFVYTGEITLHVDTVQDTLQIATLLGVEEIINVCSEFMSQHLTEQNVVQVWLLAQNINCTKLMSEAECFMNYDTFAASSDFLQIPLQLLINILSSDQFNVKNEEEVVKFVRCWVEHEKKREAHISALLDVIRLDQLPITTLLELEQWEPVNKSIVGLQKISRAKDYYLAGLFNTPQPLSSGRPPRNSYAGVLICVGGRGNKGDPYKSVEYLEAGGTKQWKELPNMINARRHVGAVALDGCLYAVGGHSGDEHLASVECFSLATKKWQLRRQMHTPRRGIALAVVDYNGVKCIFAIGGLDDTTCYNNVERYDPHSDAWKSVANLRIHRGGVCAVTYNGEVYAIGGNDGVQSKSCCEKYSPLLDKWDEIPLMGQRRAGAGATVSAGKIYVAGGFDDNAPLSSVEVYDPRQRQWTLIADMTSPRGGVGLAPLSGNLVAVGGHNGKEYLKSVEIYLVNEKRWIQGPPTKRARAGSGIAWIQSDANQLEKEPDRPPVLPV